MRCANEREQARRQWFAVEVPVGVENLVPAMFGVGLRKHHQLSVGRIPPEHLIAVCQIIDFIRGECQT